MICSPEADASAASYLYVRDVAESLKRRMAFFLSDFSSFILSFSNDLFPLHLGGAASKRSSVCCFDEVKVICDYYTYHTLIILTC